MSYAIRFVGASPSPGPEALAAWWLLHMTVNMARVAMGLMGLGAGWPARARAQDLDPPGDAKVTGRADEARDRLAGLEKMSLDAAGARFANHGAAAVFVSAASLLMSGPASAEGLSVEPGLIVYEGYGGARLTSPASVAFDAGRQEIVVANTGLGRIEVMRLDGRPTARLLHPVRKADGSQGDGEPRGLALDREGRLLVVDNLAAYVDVLDVRGRSVARLNLPPGADSSLTNAPGCVAVEPAGTILVGTRGDEGKVYRYGPDYKLLGSWGETGSEPGRLSRISCLTAMPDGKVVVGCVGTELAVQLFDPEGRYLSGFGRHDIGPGNFSFPSAVAATSDGRIWVADELRQVIQAFDSTGSYLGTIGTGGQEPGQFLYPSAVACLGDTLLAVTERVGNRLQLLKIR